MTVATMRILGWKVEGLRCPDHEIDCRKTDDEPFPVTLIQMPNGTGKTTTLTLLRVALSGDAGEWSESQVQEMKKKEGSDEEGFFELYLMLDGKRVTIRMDFYFGSNRVFYKTTRGLGRKDGFNPPPNLRRFMTPEFVDFYIFDGELAENLLDRKNTHAEKAIENLFQIHLLNRMRGEIAKYWQKQTRHYTGAGQTAHTRRTKLLGEWETRLKELLTKKSKLEEDLIKVTDQRAHQLKKHDQELKRHKHQEQNIRKAEDAVKVLKNRIDDHAKRVLDKMRDPHALSSVFANEVFELKESLDRLQLPESAAREFFEDLSNEEECVCGREINQDIRKTILERSRRYLGSEDVNLLSAVKASVSNAVDESREKPYEELQESVQSLSTLIEELESAENELHALEDKVAKSDPDVGKAKDEIRRLEIDEQSIISELRRLDGKDENFQISGYNKEDPKRIWAIETVRGGVKYFEEQIAEITNTLALKEKKDILEKILDKAHKKAREIITVEICKDANQRFTEIMPNNNISIEKIDGCLELKGQTKGSMGETQAVGYAFLSTLFHRANQHQLPFVVDSPCGAIDLKVRENIGKIVPQLADQFIAFMTSSERESFLDAMRKPDNTRIQYLTLFRKNVGHFIDEEAVLEKTETSDGVLVKDENFFEKFQEET